MRILFAIHHYVEADSGAAGATLRLAETLKNRNCEVNFFDFACAFRNSVDSTQKAAQFPIRLASHLARHAKAYDIIDASSGDAWAWATLGRPGAARGQGLIFRSHGLEHTADRRVREEVRTGKRMLRARYYVYNGGIRLWEVARSMQLADHAILLNREDYEFSVQQLAIPRAKASIVPHGLPDRLLSLSHLERPISNPLTIAFIGAWTDRKGRDCVVSTFANVPPHRNLRLRLLGTREPASEVLRFFPQDVRSRITVIPRFQNNDIEEHLAGCSILLSPSRTEGFNLALLEGMACGLVPLATPTGEAPKIVVHGVNGFLASHDDTNTFSSIIEYLASQPNQLKALSENARAAVAPYSWREIGETTLDVYRKARNSRRLQLALATS